MKTAAVMMFLLLVGGVLMVMAQQPPSTPMPMSEFWKHYPMPTSTPTKLQELRAEPSIEPTPVPKSDWQKAHPEFAGAQTPQPTPSAKMSPPVPMAVPSRETK